MNFRKTLTVFACALLPAGFGSAAWADDEPITDPEPPELYEEDDPRYGLSVFAGGGVTDFVADETRSFTRAGGTWDLRVGYALHEIISAEAGYVGSAQEIRALGLDEDALLLGNGLEGNLRVNVVRDMTVQPYVIGGIGWMHYDVRNADVSASNLHGDDDHLTVPLGAGIGFKAGEALIDFRGSYRFAFQDDLVRDGDTDIDDPTDIDVDNNPGLDTWAVTARLGLLF